jgi:hypothetical protein
MTPRLGWKRQRRTSRRKRIKWMATGRGKLPMKAYRNELRIALQVSIGRDAGQEILELPYPSPHDEELIKLAGRALKGRNLQTFAWLYSCKHSIEKVQEMFMDYLEVEVTAESVERYARDAKSRILSEMKGRPPEGGRRGR